MSLDNLFLIKGYYRVPGAIGYSSNYLNEVAYQAVNVFKEKYPNFDYYGNSPATIYKKITNTNDIFIVVHGSMKNTKSEGNEETLTYLKIHTIDGGKTISNIDLYSPYYNNIQAPVRDPNIPIPSDLESKNKLGKFQWIDTLQSLSGLF